MESSDNELKNFIEGETQKQRLQYLIHELTDRCWDACIDKPGPRMDSRTENCIQNCVNRFIDTTNFIVEKLEKSSQHLGSELS